MIITDTTEKNTGMGCLRLICDLLPDEKGEQEKTQTRLKDFQTRLSFFSLLPLFTRKVT